MVKLKVVFRKFRDGDIVALFPEYPADYQGRYCDDYMHIGQHGSSDYAYVISITRPAKPSEYAALLAELQAYDFDGEFQVVPVHRRTPQMRDAFAANLLAMA